MTMHKQFWVGTILAAALLFTQGGSFLVASLCPHLQPGMSACGAMSNASAMVHGSIENIQMGSMEQPPDANQDANAFAIAQPTTTCPHCVVHSRSTTSVVSLRESEAARRLGDVTIPLTSSPIACAATPPFRVPASRAHDPPETNIARYVLVNTFRI
jgi:hypothetical protein